jgi:hypothetical protein
MAAAIEIGGPVPALQLAELIALVRAEGLVVGWEEVPFQPTTATALLALAEGSTLRLVDHAATWGRFDPLEAFLFRHGIAFDRRTDAKYEYDAELVRYRPGMSQPCVRPTNQDHEPVMAVRSLEPIRQALQGGHVQQALTLLEDHLGPEIPALQPLCVTENPAAIPDAGRRRP